MVVLLTILKILAVVLGVVVVLVVVAVLLPLGFAVEYHPGRLRISAVYGPLRRTIWSKHLRPPKMRHKEDEAVPPQPSSFSKEPPAQRETAGQAPSGATVSEPEAPVTTPQKPPQISSEAAEPQPAPQAPPEEEEVETSAVMGRVERIAELLAEDPKTLANCVLGHMHWLQKHSFFKVHVRHLNVFWTVTCDDAAKTAVAYGAEIAALNTALALVQQSVLLQSDRLWLEPDFLGTRRQERHISCTVSASAILMFHLLYRIWKDPLLQPSVQSEPQSI